MKENNGKMNWQNVFVIVGAFLAFSIGSAFGTGQDAMQWFAAHGVFGIPSYMFNCSLIALFVVLVVRDARRYGLRDSKDVFAHYCGKHLGLAFHWYAILLVFGLAVLMVSGSGATLSEYYGLNSIVGRSIMTVLILVTVVAGLEKTVGAISFLGPLILLFVMGITIIKLSSAPMTIMEGGTYMQESTEVLRAGSSWFSATMMYFTYVIILQVPYLAGVADSTEGTTKETLFGFGLGGILMGLAGAVIVISFLKNAPLVHNSDVPILTMALGMPTLISSIFGLVLMAAIYTTAAPMAWSSVTAVVKEDSKYYKLGVIITCILLLLLSGLTTFGNMFNIISTVSGKVGIVFMIPFLYTLLIRRPAVPEIVVEPENKSTIQSQA